MQGTSCHPITRQSPGHATPHGNQDLPRCHSWCHPSPPSPPSSRHIPTHALVQVHIFVCAHADAVQEHLKARGWLASRKFRVHVVVSTNCLSVGEALRVMDNRDVVKSDFILVAGGFWRLEGLVRGG